jgi:hypothetical protein
LHNAEQSIEWCQWRGDERNDEQGKKEMHYFSLTVGKTVFTCLTITEAKDLQSRVGGKIEIQFSN